MMGGNLRVRLRSPCCKIIHAKNAFMRSRSNWLVFRAVDWLEFLTARLVLESDLSKVVPLPLVWKTINAGSVWRKKSVGMQVAK